MENSKKNLKIKLKAKLNEEFNTYKTELLKEDKNIIFENSYQTNVKNEIKNIILDIADNYTYGALETVYNSRNVLETFYQDWKRYGPTFSEELENSVFESMGEVLKKDRYER